jgi:hypothetical protein
MTHPFLTRMLDCMGGDILANGGIRKGTAQWRAVEDFVMSFEGSAYDRAGRTSAENEQLRAERVKLQGENESLRHDLEEARAAMPDGSARDFAIWLTVQPTPIRVGGSETVYAIFDALADYEKQKNLDPEPVLTPTGSEARDIEVPAQRLARVEDRVSEIVRDANQTHTRIDRVVEIVGNRIDELFQQAAKADLKNADLLNRWQESTNAAHRRIARLRAVLGGDDMNDMSDAPGYRSVLTRIGDLENLAKTRGARLDDLERRQDVDDHDRASGDGMPEAPAREDEKTGIDGLDARLDAEARADEFPVVRQTPTHENGQQVAADTYWVGDEVRLGGAPTGGGRSLTGWYRVTGVAPHKVFALQVCPLDNPLDTPALYWIARVSVLEVRHASR